MDSKLLQGAAGEAMTLLPASRNSDPATSHLASAEITSSGKRATHVAKVVAVVRREPGLVAREISERCGLDYIETVRRLSDGKNAGSIEQRGARKSNGRLCSEWWPVGEGG